jgi:hypothetical protein
MRRRSMDGPAPTATGALTGLGAMSRFATGAKGLGVMAGGGSKVLKAKGLGGMDGLGRAKVLGAAGPGLAKVLAANGPGGTAGLGVAKGLGAKGLGGPGVSEASGAPTAELLALFADNSDGGGAYLRGWAGLAVSTA